MNKNNSLLGIVGIGLLAFHLYNRKQKNSAPKIHYVDSIKGNFNAKCIPPFGIFIDKKEKDNVNLLNHELMHWQQYKKLGLVSYHFNYFYQYHLLGYDQMPMEKQARFIESDYCKNNYTECVRNGTAKTVSNPIFRT